MAGSVVVGVMRRSIIYPIEAPEQNVGSASQFNGWPNREGAWIPTRLSPILEPWKAKRSTTRRFTSKT